MLEFLIIPAVLGVGLTWDFIEGKVDDYTAEAEALKEVKGPDDLRINGTESEDELAGGDGDDSIFGAGGNDTVFGGPGDDRIFLGDGDDTAAPVRARDDAGDDFIRGGAGADVIVDTQGTNTIYGDVGADTISTLDRPADGDTAAASSADTVHGGYGMDTLVGDNGDELTGGNDVDHFIVAAPSQDDHAPVVVTDFDPENETLSIVFMDEEPDDMTVSFLHDAEAGLLRAMVEGEEVATLAGLEADDIPFISAHAMTLPTLMASDLLG